MQVVASTTKTNFKIRIPSSQEIPALFRAKVIDKSMADVTASVSSHNETLSDLTFLFGQMPAGLRPNILSLVCHGWHNH